MVRVRLKSYSIKSLLWSNNAFLLIAHWCYFRCVSAWARQKTGLLKKGQRRPAPAEETEVFGCEQGSSQDLLRHSGGLSAATVRWGKQHRQEETNPNPNQLLQRAGPVLGCSLNSAEDVAEQLLPPSAAHGGGPGQLFQHQTGASSEQEGAMLLTEWLT